MLGNYKYYLLIKLIKNNETLYGTKQFALQSSKL